MVVISVMSCNCYDKYKENSVEIQTRGVASETTQLRNAYGKASQWAAGGLSHDYDQNTTINVVYPTVA
jgi:hypothetical protein